MSILEHISSPKDLGPLSYDELDGLAEEIREKIKTVVSETGGHLATNLGIVELTIALNRVFDFSKDRIVFDVGHQCYSHKILTGRNEQFHTLRQKDGISGYPNRDESPYDTFNAGHAGTSISAALGIACGDEIRGTDRKIVALIGDGSIPTGLAFEGLNQLGHLRKNMIIVLNDNEMAISKTVGALSRYLVSIRTGKLYNRGKNLMQAFLRLIPFGTKLRRFANGMLHRVIHSMIPGYFFEELGLRYFGPVDGHSIHDMESIFRKCRKLSGPVIIHVKTTKGHGYKPAKDDPEAFHGASPFYIHDGSSRKKTGSDGRSYSKVFADTLTEYAEKDESVIAITAAMPLGTGLNVFEQRHPERFFDVGICESHAVTFAGGLSETGHKPVIAIYSTFLQRSYDQIFHDISMQGDMNVLFALDRAGLVGSDGFSHHGIADISMMRTFPGIVLMAPKDALEFEMMIRHGLETRGVFALRYPREVAPERVAEGEYPDIETGRGEVLVKGRDIVLAGYGAMVGRCVEAASILKEEGTDITVVNLRFAKPLDIGLLEQLEQDHDILVTVEDHFLSGGLGSAVLEACHEHEIRFSRIYNAGIPDRYIPHASRSEQLAALGLDAEGIAQKVRTVWSRT